MLKFIIVGLILATVSSAPLESTLTEKSNDTHSQAEEIVGLVRPSPINPDIPMDPKPAERIILDDTKSERDQKSLNEKSSSDDHEPQEHLKSELSEPEPKQSELSEPEPKRSENNEEKKLTVKSDDKENDDKKSVIEYNHDDVKGDGKDAAVASAKSDLKAKTEAKESIKPVKSDEPTIVYAVKADETQRSGSFETSHRIPNVDAEGERKFETSHHIPTHIETERIKLIENAKVADKESN